MNHEEIVTEALNTAARDSGFPCFQSMRQCAGAWHAVVSALDQECPQWRESPVVGTLEDCAVHVIRSMTNPRPAEYHFTPSWKAPALCYHCGMTPEKHSNAGNQCSPQAVRRLVSGNAVSILRGVLCDQEGRVCITGTDEDRESVRDALDRLEGVNP